MTFEIIKLSTPPYFYHRGEINIPLRGKLFHLHVHFLEKQKELEYKQKQVMELYAHHMKMIEEEKKTNLSSAENDEYIIED